MTDVTTTASSDGHVPGRRRASDPRVPAQHLREALQPGQLRGRLGTPALTTLGFGPDELDEVADVIVTALRATTPATSTAKAKYELDPGTAEACRSRCADLLARHRLYPEIEL